jgi:oxygen-independent coproporphyrinogen-3 oxidase
LPGIYIHIPYCRQACHYCDFHFSVSGGFRDRLIPALSKELILRRDEYNFSSLQTLYFGGGTPSLLSSSEWDTLLNALHSAFSFAQDIEFTVEANPDDLNSAYLKNLKTLGVNRLSIGVQSFREDDLSYMNRSHTASQAIYCIPLAQDAGIDNISIDLIYGTPGLNNDAWLNNLQTAFSLNIRHLSSYALTVEEDTPLKHLIRRGLTNGPDEEVQSAQFLLLQSQARTEGFEPYEISNYARPGYRSAHNSSYWAGKAYLGIGPSAHSFDGINKRSWNISNNALYVNSIEKGIRPSSSEILTREQQASEYILIRLRTIEGISLGEFEQIFGFKALNHIIQKQQTMPSEWFSANSRHLSLSDSGKLFADHIASELFPESI